MTSYGAAAQRARAFLTKKYNDLDVYVEDTKSQNMWIRIVNAMLEGRGTVTAVFPQGGRDAVIRQCSLDTSPGGRSRIYIIDADLDLLTGAATPALSRLYRLQVYCVENLLISESGIVDIASEAKPDATPSDLMSAIAFERRLAEAVAVLLPLYTAYAVWQRLGLSGFDTVSFPVMRFCAHASDIDSLSPALVRARIRTVLAQVYSRAPRSDYVAAKRAVRAQMSGWRGKREDLISGSACLLPLAKAPLRQSAGLQESDSRLSVRLAKYVTAEAEPSLAIALQSALLTA